MKETAAATADTGAGKGSPCPVPPAQGDPGLSPTAEPRDDRTLVLCDPAAPSAGPVAQASLPAGTRLHEFEVTGLIGEGGFGIVYLAYDHQLQRRVALKEYLPATLALRGHGQEVTLRSQRHAETFAKGLHSFINEARLLARFDHPALVKVHRFWQANGTAYLVMPYCEGPTLKASRLAMPEPPAEDWIRRLLAPLLDALELIHDQDCLHRDIAPDNILMIEGRPLLLDFGAARQVVGDRTQAMTVILKPGYAPIEQYAEMPGIRQGPWTDLYALGAVIHFLITGQAPPPSVGRLMRDSRTPLATHAADRYSAALLGAIDRCLALRAEDRPKSVAQLRALIDPAAPAGFPAVADAADGKDEVPARNLRPGRWGWAAIVAAGLLGGWWMHQQASGSPGTDTGPAGAGAAASLPATAAVPVVREPVRGDLETAWPAIVQASSDYGLTVSGVRNPLRTGQDSLELELRSAHDGWLYLLLWDQANQTVGLLLPNAADRDNRIEAGKPLILPRPGWRYVADSPAGIWEVLLIVSQAPRSFPALSLAPDGAMLVASRDRIEQALVESGNAALSGMPECGTAAGCAPGYAALRLTLQEIEAR